MDLQVEQGCPQCGAPVTLSETDRLLTCPYCGVKNFLQTSGTFRYILPDSIEEPERRHMLHAPYIRFKSNVYSVSETGIAYRVVDTTQLGHTLPGLPPTLGMRPQAMKLARISPKTEGKFLRMSVKTKSILERAALLTKLTGKIGQHLFHRAYIGDTLSLIYLPLVPDDTHLVDGITNNPLVNLEKVTSHSLKGIPFNPRWHVNFLSTLCPRCGWNLDGERDCLVLMCSNCDTAWEIGDQGLQQIKWQVQPGDSQTPLYLAFWKITASIPALAIFSFADFVERSNQPVVSRSQWHDRDMSFWIPAFKLRPKIFLHISRQVTISQWRLQPDEGHVIPNLYAVTLPKSEARQAIKITLAASTITPKNVYPYLPESRIKNASHSLVFLPFTDKGHDWLQPHTGAVIAKSILHFGRKL
ncbi:MAG: hypothetical protein ACWGN1_01380 [Desulfobulbales bacterium]